MTTFIKKTLFLIGVVFTVNTVFGQEFHKPEHVSAPIPVEVFFGNSRFVSQITIDKKFGEGSQLGIFGYSYVAGDYNNDKSENESVNAMLLTYEIYRGLGLASGVVLNSAWGFRPFAAPRYVYVNKNFLISLISGFYLTESNNFESIGVIEYRPHIKNELSLYTRVEGLYNEDMNTKKHDRSYLFGRMGLSYKTFGFGFAMNYDWYGPHGAEKENYGVFLRAVLR